MPNTIDERIVEMQFDNKNFERNIKQSLNSLEQLDKALEMKDATKGFENLEKAANNIDLSKLEKAADAIEKRFSTAGIAGAAVINRAYYTMEENSENAEISKTPETPVQIKQSPELTEMEATEKNDINLFFKKTLRNTISAFLLSMISAVINFFVNIPLLRKVSKESYGIVKVYFELAFTLVNFIPRESIRRASQKFCPDHDPVKEKRKFNTISQINYIFFFARR